MQIHHINYYLYSIVFHGLAHNLAILQYSKICYWRYYYLT